MFNDSKLHTFEKKTQQPNVLAQNKERQLILMAGRAFMITSLCIDLCQGLDFFHIFYFKQLGSIHMNSKIFAALKNSKCLGLYSIN